MILYKSGIDGKMFLTHLDAINHNKMLFRNFGKDKELSDYIYNIGTIYIETEKDKKIKLINKKLKEIEKDFTVYEKD